MIIFYDAFKHWTLCNRETQNEMKQKNIMMEFTNASVRRLKSLEMIYCKAACHTWSWNL